MTPKQASALQLDYIREQRKLMKRLAKALDKYQATAKALGFHPLTASEIHDRMRQLDSMEREARSSEYGERAAKLANMLEATP